MKRQAYTLIGALVLTVMFAFSTVDAQTANRAVVNIPFDFSAGEQTLPAGKYVISATDSKIQRIRSLDGRFSALLQMQAVQGKVVEAGKLVFHRYGDRYFLAQFWTPAYETGLEAATSRAERAAARETVATRHKLQTVTVALNR